MIAALDTATSTASVALYDAGADRVLAEQTWQARRRQTEETLPVLQAMMARLDREPEAIDAIAVTTGPGSFTGVRIAISMAKGMALGLPQRPRLVGVPTLAVTAAPWIDLAVGAGATVWAFLQAGRGRYNWTVFEAGMRLHRPTAAEHSSGNAERLAAARRQADGPIWLVGESSQAVGDVAATLPLVSLIDPVSGWRRSGHLARLAALHLAAGHEESVDSLRPLYLSEPG